MSDTAFKRIIVTVIALMSLLLWRLHEERPEDCLEKCTTDISAKRR